MAGSTADDHLTVDGDAMFVVGADPEHAAGPSLSAADHQTVNGGTQWMVLSAAVNSPMVSARCSGEGYRQRAMVSHRCDKDCLCASG